MGRLHQGFWISVDCSHCFNVLESSSLDSRCRQRFRRVDIKIPELICGGLKVVNTSLGILQRKEKIEGAFEVHPIIPLTGTLLCGLLLLHAEKSAWMVASGVFVAIGLVFALLRPELDQSTQNPPEA